MTTTQRRSGRVLGARITSGLLGLAILAMTQVYLSALLADPTGPHATHEYTNVIYGLVLGAPFLVVALRASTAVGALRFGFAGATAGLVGLVASRDFAPDLLIWTIALMALPPVVDAIGGFGMWRGAWVKPGRLLWLPLLLLVGFATFMANQISLQAAGSMSDPHVEMRHYSYMAIAVLSVGLGGLVATPAVPGRRAAGVMAGAAAALLGLGSMLIGGPSEFGTVGEVALVVGGVTFVGLALRHPDSGGDGA